MSTYNPDTARTATSQSPAADTQMIIGLLGNLMPLLLQLQSQYPAQYPGQISQGSFGQGGFGSGQGGFTAADAATGFGNLAPPNPMLDHQAAVEMIEDINANALRTLSAYLENYANQHAGLADCVPIVTQAVRLFAARDHAQTFNLIWQAYRAIAMARALDPQLPPPRIAGTNVSSSSTSVLH
jgi:hypothetical protein